MGLGPSMGSLSIGLFMLHVIVLMILQIHYMQQLIFMYFITISESRVTKVEEGGVAVGGCCGSVAEYW